MKMYENAGKYGGSLQEGCIVCYGMNARLRDSLVKKRLAEFTSGYGFGYGNVLQITEKGYDEAKKIKEKVIKING